jgi:hypothetical protein
MMMPADTTARKVAVLAPRRPGGPSRGFTGDFVTAKKSVATAFQPL